MAAIDFHRLSKYIPQFKNKKIAVLGDLMIDQYTWGTIQRISPEAPVPIVEVQNQSNSLGGAANVANNLQSLGVEVIPTGVIGDDDEGQELINMITDAGFTKDGIFIDGTRRTTIKTRIIAHNQHVVRIDRESKNNISPKTARLILEFLESEMPKLDALILEDYNKGLLTRNLIREVIALAHKNDVITTVDPKFNHFLDYKGVTLFKPNRKETEEATAQIIHNIDDCVTAAISLRNKLQCENILITLGEEGMVLVDKNDQFTQIPTQAKKVHDVSGAGDTVISTLTACLTAGASIFEAAHMANFAASIVIAEIGAVPIDPQKLQHVILEQKS
ncbi:MAG: D-glycero-beta-D-manno-heptose-7-phosphate kinase [Calditrichaeota bacterium]|nr:MAG: D-glycero-beta-D-manno-heptose-7-phosphate kinase [Calditrichota bacterium]